MRPRIVALLAVPLAACGLFSPPEPPASEVVVTDQPPVPDAPIPFAPPPGGALPEAPTPTPPPPGGQAPDPADPWPAPPWTAPPDTPPFPDYRLAWHDEFDGSAIDEKAWHVQEGPNRDGILTREAVAVVDGALRLTTFTNASGQHETGIVVGAQDLTYGYFEARLRPNANSGNWCAFWITSPTIGNPIGDPGTAGVEIDVIEHRFENRERYDLSNYTYMNLNWDGFGAEWKKDGRLTTLPGNAPIQHTWRTYAVLWTDAGYVFYVDGVPIWRTAAAISNRSENVVLSCEVKNNSWAGWFPPGGYGTRETSVTGMQVDWIRVWQRATE